MSDLELTKKSASEIIQIDAIVSKTPKVYGDTKGVTRKAEVQLTIVEDDENLTSEPCCAPTNQPYCRTICIDMELFLDIETTIRARKFPNPCQILTWIYELIVLLSCAIFFVRLYGVIGDIFWVGTVGAVIFGIFMTFFVSALLIFCICLIIFPTSKPAPSKIVSTTIIFVTSMFNLPLFLG